MPNGFLVWLKILLFKIESKHLVCLSFSGERIYFAELNLTYEKFRLPFKKYMQRAKPCQLTIFTSLSAGRGWKSHHAPFPVAVQKICDFLQQWPTLYASEHSAQWKKYAKIIEICHKYIILIIRFYQIFHYKTLFL